MIKKDRLFLLLFIFSINSMFVAILLKMLNINIFNIANYNYEYPILETILKFFILISQYILIIGCITRLSPKILIFKILPYLPLTLILYYLPNDMYFYISALILFVTSLSIMPKFSTMIRFFLNIIFISFFQLIMIWLRLDIKHLETIFPSFMQMLIMNIDQFIILFLLYAMNRRWGDNYVAIFRRKK